MSIEIPHSVGYAQRTRHIEALIDCYEITDKDLIYTVYGAGRLLPLGDASASNALINVAAAAGDEQRRRDESRDGGVSSLTAFVPCARP